MRVFDDFEQHRAPEKLAGSKLDEESQKCSVDVSIG